MDTIFGLATVPNMKSGAALIKISGKDSLKILKAFGFKRKTINPRMAYYMALTSPETGEILDEIIALYFQGPQSFTGEDMVEFHTHGSIAVVRDVLKQLSKLECARIAEPGEFTKRAFINGKIDLQKVESLAALIDAETSMQRQLALKSAHLRELYQNWRIELIEVMTRVEALIDFPEDDIPLAELDAAERTVSALLNEIRNYYSSSCKAVDIMNGIAVVICGNPNSGKSSILNAVSGRDVAIVSEYAGTTRDVVQVKLEIAGFPIILQDTAGLRETNNPIELEGIRRTKAALKAASIAILVLDSTEATHDIATSLSLAKNCSVLVVHNKSDLLMPKINEIDEIYPQATKAIAISAKTGQGIPEMLEHIAELVVSQYSPDEAMTIVQERQRNNIKDCIEHLESFSISKSLEICAQDLRFAVKALSIIIGPVDIEEVLTNIFKSFCIGK